MVAILFVLFSQGHITDLFFDQAAFLYYNNSQAEFTHSFCEMPVDYFSTCASCPCLPLGTVYSVQVVNSMEQVFVQCIAQQDPGFIEVSGHALM